MELQITSPETPPVKASKKGWDLLRSTRFRSKRCSDPCVSLTKEDIQESDFFRGRSEAFVNTVTDFFQLATFVAGEYIMRQGEDGDRLVFLYRGAADVLVGAQEVKVASLGSGKVFGEIALLGAAKRTASIRASEFCDCRVLDRHTFRRLLRKFPEEHAYFQLMAKERREELAKIKADAASERRGSLPELRVKGTQRRRSSAAAHQLAKACLQARHALAERSHTEPHLPCYDDISNESGDDVDHQFFSEQESSAAETQIPRKINTEPLLPLASMLSDSENESPEACPRFEDLVAKVNQECSRPSFRWKGRKITPLRSSEQLGWIKRSIPNYAYDTGEQKMLEKTHSGYQQFKLKKDDANQHNRGVEVIEA